jgi:HD superfamily phosphohydrolase
LLKWTPSKINNFTSCEVFLQLAEESTRKKSSTEAMRDAGFSEEEIQNLMRAQENAVRRAKSRMKTNKVDPIDLPIQDLNINADIPISPLSEMQSTQSKDTTLIASKSVLTKTSNKMAPGMKAVHQTSHQAHAMAQNAFLLRKLRDSATKEATKAWVEASKPCRTKKEIIEMINNKRQYKGFVKVYERTIQHLVAEGIIGVTPPRRGHDDSIPPVAYRALKDAMTSFISIHQASGRHEHRMSDLSRIIKNDLF